MTTKVIDGVRRDLTPDEEAAEIANSLMQCLTPLSLFKIYSRMRFSVERLKMSDKE